jgi:hypothetical protein
MSDFGREDCEAESRDEEVVACADEEGSDDYKAGLDCIRRLGTPLMSAKDCVLEGQEGREEEHTIEDRFLTDTERTTYPVTSRQAPTSTTTKYQDLYLRKVCQN